MELSLGDANCTSYSLCAVMCLPIQRSLLQAIVVALALSALGACEAPAQDGEGTNYADKRDTVYDSVVVPMVRYDPATFSIDTIKGIPEGVLIIEGVWSRDSSRLVLGCMRGAYILDADSDSCRSMEGIPQDAAVRLYPFRSGRTLVAVSRGSAGPVALVLDEDASGGLRVPELDDEVVTVERSPSGTAMLVIAKSSVYWVRDNATAERVAYPNSFFKTFHRKFGWNRDGSVLLIGTAHQGIFRFDQRTLHIEHIPSSAPSSISKMVVSSDQDEVYIGVLQTDWMSPDIKSGFLRYDFVTDVLEPVPVGPAGSVLAIARMDSGYLLVAGSDALYRYSETRGQAEVVPGSRGLDMTDVIPLPGDRALVSEWMKGMYKYDRADGVLRAITSIPAGYVTVSPVDSESAYLGGNGAALRYDASQGTAHPMPGAGESGSLATVSPDGRHLFAMYWKAGLYQHDLRAADWNARPAITGHGWPVNYFWERGGRTVLVSFYPWNPKPGARSSR